MFNDYDVIILSETWLDSEIYNFELILNNYTIYRCNKSIFTSSKTFGVGVLIVVKSTLSSSVIPVLDNPFGQLIVRIHLSDKPLILAAASIPPLVSSDYYRDYVTYLWNSLDAFDNGLNIDDCLIVGDF